MEVMKLIARCFGGLIIFGGSLLIGVGAIALVHSVEKDITPVEVIMSLSFGILAIYGGHALYRWGDGQIFKELE